MRYKTAWISDVIALIKETQGKNAKQEILAAAVRETPNFKEFLVAVFHPIIRYHIRKIPKYRRLPDGHPGAFELKKVFATDMLDVLSKRQKTGGEAEKYLEWLLENMPAKDAIALEMIIERKIDCGVSIGSVNKVCPGLVKEFPCMLATAYSKELVEGFKYPALAQNKEDGLRANLVVRDKVLTTFSRNGKDLGLDEVFEFAVQGLNNTVLDGEIRVLDSKRKKFLPRKKSNGLINKISKGGGTDEEKSRVCFIAWDIIPLATFEEASKSPTLRIGYVSRLTTIETHVKRIASDRLRVVTGRFVNSPEDAMRAYQDAIELGEEGIILKDPDSFWCNARPKYQIKVKAERTCSLIVVAVNEGTGRRSGKVGALVCESSDGVIRVAAGSGLNDEDIARPFDYYIGKIVEIKYNERITNEAGNHSLFLPRFIEVRFDKTVADSSGEIE